MGIYQQSMHKIGNIPTSVQTRGKNVFLRNLVKFSSKHLCLLRSLFRTLKIICKSYVHLLWVDFFQFLYDHNVQSGNLFLDLPKNEISRLYLLKILERFHSLFWRSSKLFFWRFLKGKHSNLMKTFERSYEGCKTKRTY